MDDWRRDQIEIARRNIANGIPDSRWCGDPVCDLNGVEHGHGGPRQQVFLNGVDLSGYVTNAELAHDADDKTPWHERLSGLKQSSFTVSGSFDASAYFPAIPTPSVLVTHQVPDGRWQHAKWWLKARLPRLLAWLKVRFVVHSFHGVVEPWPKDMGATVRADGPVTRTTETRRGDR